MKIIKKGVLVGIYLILLFLCCVGIWIFIHFIQKHKVSSDVLLEKKIINVLVANGIVQNDILIQYVREKTEKTVKWNKFYKIIKLKDNRIVQSFETNFKNIARSMRMNLRRMNNSDGSITYKFYLSNRNYYSITFIYSR
ncbi:MAG: hypothetical protein LBJ68_01260 [Endomicrobium sp.]|nr:hypothetical protein [Endomicrobium sp.]